MEINEMVELSAGAQEVSSVAYSEAGPWELS